MLKIGQFQIFMHPNLRIPDPNKIHTMCFMADFEATSAKIEYLNFSDKEDDPYCMVQNGTAWADSMLRLVDTCATNLTRNSTVLSDASFLRDIDIYYYSSNDHIKKLIMDVDKDPIQDDLNSISNIWHPLHITTPVNMNMSTLIPGMSYKTYEFIKNIENKTLSRESFKNLSLSVFLISIRGYSYYEARGYFTKYSFLKDEMYSKFHNSIFSWRQEQIVNKSLAKVLQMYYSVILQSHDDLNGEYRLIYKPGFPPDTMIFFNDDSENSLYMIINDKNECVIKREKNLRDDRLFEAKFTIPDVMNQRKEVHAHCQDFRGDTITHSQKVFYIYKQQIIHIMPNILNEYKHQPIRDIVLTVFDRIKEEKEYIEEDKDILGNVLKALFHVVEYTLCRDIDMESISDFPNERSLEKVYNEKGDQCTQFKIVHIEDEIKIVEETVSEMSEFIQSIQMVTGFR